VPALSEGTTRRLAHLEYDFIHIDARLSDLRRPPHRDRLVRARDLLAEVLAQLRPPEGPQGEGPPPVRRKARAWDTLGGRRGLRGPGG
jgi:hypothetical protein